jgi:hypothetical protein
VTVDLIQKCIVKYSEAEAVRKKLIEYHNQYGNDYVSFLNEELSKLPSLQDINRDPLD